MGQRCKQKQLRTWLRASARQSLHLWPDIVVNDWLVGTRDLWPTLVKDNWDWSIFRFGFRWWQWSIVTSQVASVAWWWIHAISERTYTRNTSCRSHVTAVPCLSRLQYDSNLTLLIAAFSFRALGTKKQQEGQIWIGLNLDRYSITVACHCFCYYFRVSIAPHPSL